MGRYRKYNNRNSDYNIYGILALCSFAFRAYLCYITIDIIPIFSNVLYNDFFLEVFSLYTFLLGISRFTTSFFYNKGRDSPYKGMGIYFVIYIIYLMLMFAIMSILTFLRVLPIMV